MLMVVSIHMSKTYIVMWSNSTEEGTFFLSASKSYTEQKIVLVIVCYIYTVGI